MSHPNADRSNDTGPRRTVYPIMTEKTFTPLYAPCFEARSRESPAFQDRPTSHWFDKQPRRFTAEQREHTTLLFGGLTVAQDRFIQAALTGLGYKTLALDCPDSKSLNLGKEFGNRGQCNPTYFTVGNLLKYLHHLRDEQGIPTPDIVENYLFVTAGTCGPCRFGMYATEYRKALRDAGFEGFRVLLFQQTDGLKQATGDNDGLAMDTRFFLQLVKAVIAGDVLNAMGYRIRAFELKPGDTDAAMKRCHGHVIEALSRRRSLLRALWRCRRELARVAVDRTQLRPRIAVIGEFWAMTTEGEGNYRLQQFLESEGAEVDVQLITAWLLYLIWGKRYDVRRREDLAPLGGSDADSPDPRGLLVRLWLADRSIRGMFQVFARVTGLYDYHLPDMEALANLSHDLYDNHLRGGEGHMEVGKVMMNVIHNKVNMTISVKPFGCMPSSGISDGVQSLVTELYPKTIFLPIETTGDGAVNIYSRIQMQLFKARQAAQQDVDEAYGRYGIDAEAVDRYLRTHPRLQRPLHRSPHSAGSTSADLIHDIGARLRSWRRIRETANRFVRAFGLGARTSPSDRRA